MRRPAISTHCWWVAAVPCRISNNQTITILITIAHHLEQAVKSIIFTSLLSIPCWHNQARLHLLPEITDWWHLLPRSTHPMSIKTSASACRTPGLEKTIAYDYGGWAPQTSESRVCWRQGTELPSESTVCWGLWTLQPHLSVHTVTVQATKKERFYTTTTTTTMY